MTTSKRRITIQDDYGQHVAAVYAPADSQDFDGADIEGLCHMFSKTLRGHSFRRAVLYGAALTGSDLSECCFDGADLRAAILDDAILVQASLRDAQLGIDNLGSATALRGANLAGADLSGADLRGAKYDARTVFPAGFSPKAAGMIEEMTANNTSERTRGS